mmetsp:Transcript_907/g.807  ORF Transcript_907/g.807 Transcript_907/m.807 type:complete len:209 (+) Transcript_907:453-1079(+)
MFGVFQVLKVGDDQATTIHQNVRKDHDILFLKNFLSIDCGWTICSLNQNLAIDFGSIFFIDSLFKGSRGQNITFFIKNAVVVVGVSNRVVGDGSLKISISHKFFGINTIGIKDRPILFNNTNKLNALSHQESGKMITNLTESLNDKSLALETSFLDSVLLNKLLITQNFSQSNVSSQTGSFSSTGDTTLDDRLASNTSIGINFFMTIS